MKSALLLIDLQNDYLATPGLEPAAGSLIEHAATLLQSCRSHKIPIIHIWTTVTREPDTRMPHWITAKKWICVQGTPGHQPPEPLKPLPDELILHKRFFNPFTSGELDTLLKKLVPDTLLLSGLHLHACVRTTALEAYERGYHILIAEDAVASDDPLHAAITRRYLSARSIQFAPTPQILNPNPIPNPNQNPNLNLNLNRLLELARRAQPPWRNTTIHHRAAALYKLAKQLEQHAEPLASLITREVAKPITQARAELQRSIDLIHATLLQANQPLEHITNPQTRHRHEPLGVVAAITPWNNPIAIPIGRIAPALLFGNAVLWKPAPAATAIAQALMPLFTAAKLDHVIQLLPGDESTAAQLAQHADAVTLSGSLRAGRALHEICARRAIPFQAELGGNNAAIIAEDADLADAARQIAHGAFAFAGQRCTANRRAIIPAHLHAQFLKLLEQATAQLPWGDPTLESTIIGPLISYPKRAATEALLRRARESGCPTLIPHRDQADFPILTRRGPYFPPAIITCDNPNHEIVQEESFAPILVLQRSNDFTHALELANGVKQGLIAALFSKDPTLQSRFLSEAKAGILKLNRSTADADAISPFGGWKASGIGPAEHGPSDREFFTRVQTIYQS